VGAGPPEVPGCSPESKAPVRGAPWEWDVKRLATHARAGQPALIAGYLGKANQFDEAVADFATAYAGQNERDYKALVRAVRQGRIEVYTES
jgi:uncharacterized protein DUF2252